jgi:hypothetical protein
MLGLVVASDGLTFTVKLAEAGTVVIDAATGTQILTAAEKRHGSSPWYWPPQAAVVTHKQMQKLLVKQADALQALQNQLNIYQRRVEVLGKHLPGTNK